MSYGTWLSQACRKNDPDLAGTGAGTEALYQYERLQGKNEIRLVVLPPGSIYSSVRCDLIHIDLDEAPDYEALSYTWAYENGDKFLSGTIFCGSDGNRIPITRNCENALRHLRLKSETRFLWIDAICIDQATLHERNSQVSLMSRIYRSASRVVVYFGKGNNDSDELFDTLNSMLNQSISTKQLEQAKQLFSFGWFKRLWVFQEITLARQAWVMCGNKTIQWRTLANFHNEYFNKIGHADDQHTKFNTCAHTRVLFQFGLCGIQRIDTFPQLFLATQSGRASDPRDKVFALLGLVEQDSHVDFIPDYGLSKSETLETLQSTF